MAFLLEDIRYEIGGIEIDRTKNVGITSTIKNLLSVRKDEEPSLKNACWLGAGQTLELTPSGNKTSVEFTFSVPLKMLMGFAEDYKRIVVNVKQELILLRSATDMNANTVDEDTTEVKLEITGLYWRVPHITVFDAYRLKLLKMVE